MIRFIKSYEAGKAKQHPVGMTQQWPEGNEAALLASPADWISLGTDHEEARTDNRMFSDSA